ncbi:flagellar filament capping protein FliD [Undibacterium sp. RTI2.1]|uniref:flagellar filament capping protein FliD n=1 Tax=unclassified Undibacterium TaxID=2630295 RepID=UPI002AB3FCBF|nr:MULTISPECIES: flagellar filament capping protein FliD [unclassified Undibacterium]MDY7537132.1 flagellar filament capping protein FliD [Undibacterium sp. 5I1]MEB0029829.1 flagellar filament capping protein FliD [Undibacterium sp. RTI2.1]MEB0115114.1 flagellar filament capping protein FliD [Undibacterium sp. RTI2.2]MEB0229310.1 flagellar filament capping protein FliD [Undibacterium sp. 10I3]MEB0256142.1 flagellar filament capping protein FliD [Undibacterium sp. 5I1]
MSIQSTGIGSGLDVNSLVSKLMQVESQPLTSLATKQASYQAKVSAYGTLNSALSSFQSAVSNLSKPSVFQSLTATSSDSTIISATAAASATAGTYNIAISQLAQSQSISSVGQASSSDAIGTGASTTVSFQLGTITGTATNGTYSGATFAQDTTQTTGTITIDSTNNSLQGIRDAINTAGVGVTASIVGDGSATPYHLVLNSSKTGVASSLKISSTGDATIANLLNYDPSGTQNFTEISNAQNANLKVNGINITSAANTVTSSLPGVTLNLTKVGSTTVSVTTNSGSVQNGVNSFVQAYNALNATITSLTAYNSSTQKGGLLLGDSTTQSVQNQIRNSLSASVNGLGGGLTTLSQIGVSFQKDGSLSLDSTKLSTALTNNFSDVGGLFASIGKTSDSLTSVAGSTSATKAGTYALNVTQLATQGSLTGDLALPATTTIDPSTTLSVTLNNLNASVAIPAGSYTPAQLATAVQTAINTTSAFSAIGSTVKASINNSGQLILQSTNYGSASNVAIADGTGTGAASLTGTQLTGTAGLDVAGTLNGSQVSGSGQTLTGVVGTNTEGLKILVAGGSVGDRGTVNYSIGYASKLTSLLNGFLGSSGTIASSTDGVNRSLKDLSKQTDDLNSRLIDIEARYRAQFTALDSIISSLNSTSTFLTQQLSALTGSSK